MSTYKNQVKYSIFRLFLIVIILAMFLYVMQHYFENHLVGTHIYKVVFNKTFERHKERHIFISELPKKEERLVSNGKEEYIKFPDINCNMSQVKLLSLVKSAPKNKRLRFAIRNTWGKYASSNGNKLVFSIGRTHNVSLEELIKEEAIRFRDILQGNFMDTYYNLTIKTMRGIHWIARFCPNARFVLLVDDDVIVNYRNLIRFFSQLQQGEINQLFTGYIVTNAQPVRKGSKFAVSLEEYPKSFYPSYVSGPVVMTTGMVLKLFDETFPFVKRFVFEDVYLGMVAEKLKIRLSPKYNKLFDHNGHNLHKLECFLTSHPRDVNVTGEFYERNYNKHKDSVCREKQNLYSLVYQIYK